MSVLTAINLLCYRQNASRKVKKILEILVESRGFDKKLKNKYEEGVLILRNKSRKLKTVADNAILRNDAVSSENISELIKNKTENGFHLKRKVCKFL